jgi:glycosyltransferase involved in cell wall biosynthesis
MKRIRSCVSLPKSPPRGTATRLSILAPIRYLSRFNTPKQSKHDISVRTFLPLNYISKKIEGVTLFNPFPPRRFDLIHAFNRIPVSRVPFIIGFESHLPRGFGIEQSVFFRKMTEQLISPKCRAIIAISQWARRLFLKMHEGSDYYDELYAKLHVRLPNMTIGSTDNVRCSTVQQPIRIVFVGNHFGRKGGCVTIRMAELATAHKFPMSFDIISKFEVGRPSWTDPTDERYFDHYRNLLTLPNVRYHGALPNPSVLSLVRQAHFSILTTFSDTFGFSAIESMANYTPVVATAQGALPEFVRDGDNGVLLDLATDNLGEWIHLRDDRSSVRYAALHSEEVDRLARAALQRIMKLVDDTKAYHEMRRNAHTTAIELFSAEDATKYWDDMYERAIDGIVVAEGR